MNVSSSIDPGHQNAPQAICLITQDVLGPSGDFQEGTGSLGCHKLELLLLAVVGCGVINLGDMGRISLDLKDSSLASAPDLARKPDVFIRPLYYKRLGPTHA